MKKRIVGYCDRQSSRPGDKVGFMVSCAAGEAEFSADIVRVISGDPQPGAPGLKVEPVKTGIEGSYPAVERRIRSGSYVRVERGDRLAADRIATIQATIWPTLPRRGEQAIVSIHAPSRRSGIALRINARGCLSLLVADGATVHEFDTGKPLETRVWQFVAASIDRRAGKVSLWQQRLDGPAGRTVEHDLPAGFDVADPGVPLLIGGAFETFPQESWEGAVQCFNGRIERPAVAGRPLSLAQMQGLRSAVAPLDAAPDLHALWDFGLDIPTDRVVDISPNGLDGEAVNLPVRAVRGSGWSGRHFDWRQAPGEYAAMHFLEDSLYDCGWPPSFELTVPAGLRSGFYAARIRCGGEEDFIPFFVRPAAGAPTSKLLFLVPTASYLAYTNWRLPFENPASEFLMSALPVIGPEDEFLIDHPEIGPSLYDTHLDGLSAHYSSQLRPNLNMRPTHGWLEQYPADLYITNFLEEQGLDFDVMTDEDLDREGVSALDGYRCVLTGSHPEYYSTGMLDALDAFLGKGGRLAYLGGNGFVWRVAFRHDKPGVIEMRRAESSSSIGANAPGEYHLGFSGELGGQWKRLGRPPQALCGVGFIAQGFDYSASYGRLPDSFDPRAAFIFEGIGADERIGNFGMLGNGAGGVEVDCYSVAEGTPPHALRLATTAGAHTATYVYEGTYLNDPEPEVRADLVFLEAGAGGAVFSVGSMAWATSLAYNGGDNNVARVTENVVRRFLDERPF